MRHSTGQRGVRPLALLAALVTMAAFAGCATSGPATQAVPGGGPIDMRAGDFAFAPNILKVKGTGSITLRINNDSGTAHDLTIRDPAGKVMTKVELPPGKTATATVSLAAPGIYKFDCSKPFHATLGMTGRIEVTG